MPELNHAAPLHAIALPSGQRGKTASTIKGTAHATDAWGFLNADAILFGAPPQLGTK